MLRQTFPPGADIGLHASIIDSITKGGNTNFLYNYYHMGGGSSVTFPGYHIFTSYIILLTGMNDYVAQAVVVSLFSSLVVVVAFLLTRKIWNTSAALIVAFLVAVSRFDIEMLMWGGYPNVIAIMLIPLAFYLFLEKDRFSVAPFLIVSSLVSGAIFLTHSLSAVLFIVITLGTVVFTLIFAGRMGERRRGLILWLLPLILGAVAIAPFLIQVAPAYLGADASTFTGGVTAIKEALLATKMLPLDIVVPLLIFVFLYFPFSKYYTKRFLSLPTVLLVLWWLLPTVLTQGYLFGVYTDYNRFLYYVILPVIMLIGLGFYHTSKHIGQGLGWLFQHIKQTPQVQLSNSKVLRKALPHLEEKTFALILTFILVLYAFLSVGLFAPPVSGVGLQSFYQLMNEPEYDAIQWAKANTAPSAVFLTDAQYGWWFGGFAERPTLSAVSPEYLTNSREFAPATMAYRVLDTDFLVDNGIIQVREDGGFIGRHNPDFYAKRPNQYFPYGFFTFDNTEITATFLDQKGNSQFMDLTDLSVTDQHMENNSDYASIFVTRANSYFTFTEETTVYKGIGFANLTMSIASSNPDVTFVSLRFTLHTIGTEFRTDDGSSLGFFNTWDKVAGQLIFAEGQPFMTGSNFDNPGTCELTYALNSNSFTELNLYAGVYQYDANAESDLNQQQELNYYQGIMTQHAQTKTDKVSDLPLDVFDYHQALAAYNVSYIALRDIGQIPRFAKDPTFSLVFINNDVAIFKVVQK